jgi:hypothetical protein
VRWEKFILLVFCLVLGLSSATAHAATVSFDISDLAGFQTNGVTGIAGNGVVFLSPKYTVGFGDTVDFGTAFVTPELPDARANPCGLCLGFSEILTFNLVDGVGGLASPPFDLFGTGEFNPEVTVTMCPNFVCGIDQSIPPALHTAV